MKAIVRFLKNLLLPKPCMCRLIDKARAELGVTKVSLEYGTYGVEALVYRRDVLEYASREDAVAAVEAALAKLRNYLAESAS